MNLLIILTILYVLSAIGLFIYIYIIPWSKGTFVSDNCKEPCKPGSYCCRDPRQGGPDCMIRECSSIWLEYPKQKQIKFFNWYMVGLLIFLVISIILQYLKNNSKIFSNIEKGDN